MRDAPYIRIPLHRADGSVRAYALVDQEDSELATFRWSMNPDGAVSRTSSSRGGCARRTIYLAREVLGLVPGDGLEGDHISRDKLDNRRSNLRIVTHAQNAQNRGPVPGSASRHRGVYWCKRRRKWDARVRVGRKLHYLGTFAEEDVAADVARRFRLMHQTHTVEEAS